MRKRSFLAWGTVAAAVIGACSRVVPATSAGGSGSGGMSDAGADANDDGGCVLASLPLILAKDGTAVVAAYVPVEYQGASAAFLVDTGSGLTFLQEPVNGPDPVPDAGTVTLGCETLALIGRAEAAQAPAPNGLPVKGTLGVDQFLKGPTQIDFGSSLLSFHGHGDPFGVGGPASAPFDLAKGMVLAHVTLDGTPVRLMFDTGSEDTLWLGAQPQPGDQEVDTTDALGDPLTLWLGTVTLGLGTYTATVPVLRAPSFPYFEQTVADLGGNIQGLLGVSSMGSRVVIDPDVQKVEVTP